jgi:GT2 family glycosyltransferase
MSAAVGIVVLSWNGGAHTVACIESRLAQTYDNRFLIVVDNASAAAERDALRARYGNHPAIELCLRDENLGYAGGNNLGIRRAAERGADLFLIATQDTELAPDALARLVDAAQQHPGVGILGPCVVDATSGAELSRGERISIPLLCVPRTLLRYRTETTTPYLVSGLLGCTLLLSRSCFEKTGGFDDSLFAYYEEVDLCLRARQAGFELLCVPQAVATHDGMRGFLAGFTPLSAELKVRNLVRLMRRHARAWDWPLLLPSFAGLWLGSVLLYAARRRGDIVAAMTRGLAAGLLGEGGPARSQSRTV